MFDKDKRYYQRVSDLLARHGVVESSEEVTEASWEEKITAFQEKAKILADGDPGPVTLWALQYPFVKSDPKLKIVTVKCDLPRNKKDGFPTIKLREDCAQAFEAMAKRVRDAGGIVASSGGLRELNKEPNQHQSATSFHYTGLAFDLAVATGTWDPAKDPYVVEYREGEKRPWTVWARAAGGEQRKLKAVKHRYPATAAKRSWSAVELEYVDVEGAFVNFTQIAAEEGFQPIGPRPRYRNGAVKQYMSAEWWHFQHEASLTPEFSQFGIELLRIEGYLAFWRVFEQGQLNPRGVWANAKLVFMDKWR